MFYSLAFHDTVVRVGVTILTTDRVDREATQAGVVILLLVRAFVFTVILRLFTLITDTTWEKVNRLKYLV